MPAIKRTNQATAADALNALKFSVVPLGGAILNLWLSSVTNSDTVGLSVGSQDIIVQANMNPNIEISADVVDTDRDQVLFNEVVGPGQLFLPVTATTAINFLLHLRYL